LEASRDVAAEQKTAEKTLDCCVAFQRPLLLRTEHLPRIPIEGVSSHIDRAKEALSRGKARYKIIGGIGSRGHIWGHATFPVGSLFEARIHLRRAGFLQCSESKYVLLDSENGWKIHVFEQSLQTDQ